MSASALPRRDATPPPGLVRLFDATAMGLIPVVTSLLGYRFRVGTDARLRQDAHAVLAGVWAEEGAQAPAALAWVGERYEPAVQAWIVAYHRGRPVGVMAMCDPRVASLGLDCWQRRPPTGADLTHTREIARLGILAPYRGRGQTVMIGLLREMLAWSQRHGVQELLVASAAGLVASYRRFNPTARLLDWPQVEDEDPVLTAYFAPVRQWGRRGAVYTFQVSGASPWATASTWVRGRLAARRADGKGAPEG